MKCAFPPDRLPKVLRIPRPGTGPAILRDLLDRGLVQAPVIAVDSRYSLIARMAAGLGPPATLLLFPPRSRAGLPLPDDHLKAAWDRATIKTHLADRHRDIETTVTDAVPLLEPRIHRLRRLDDLLADLPVCALLACADPPFNLEILAGGRTLLQRTRPFVLLETFAPDVDRSVAPLDEPFALLQALDYRLLYGDYGIYDRADGADNRWPGAPSSAFLGVPSERVDQFRSSQNLPEPRQQERILCDDRLTAMGLYPAETGPAGPFRWSGPGRYITLLLPVMRPGAVRIDIEIADGYDGTGNLRIRAGCTELPCDVLHTTAGAFILRVMMNVPAFGFRGWVLLEIMHPPAIRRSSADPRRLGLAISGFHIVGSDAAP